MSEYEFSERAYAKMIFHAVKYPHAAINGILLAQKGATKGSLVKIVDAVPMFHQCLYVTPMVEIALMQIEAYAERRGLAVSGYYAAAENLHDNSLERAPALKIADKIEENHKNTCLVVIDNRGIFCGHEQPAMKVYASNESARWTKARFCLEKSVETLETVSALVKRGIAKDIVDFDNHLDNPKHDWTNEHLNKDLAKLMAMY